MTNRKEIEVLDSDSDLNLNLSLDTIANLCYPRVITCETEEDTLSIDGGVFAAFWWAANYIIDKVLMPITDNIFYYLRRRSRGIMKLHLIRVIGYFKRYLP